MPFDLALAARTLRLRHRDVLGFRQALLDLLFAAGCSVREQAVALEHGDAVCVRTTGPAAPNGEAPLVLVAVDLDAPAPLRSLGGEIPRWSEPLATLGGPDIAIGWLAALRALLSSPRQRPWEAILVRGPALGTAGYVASLLEGLPPGAEIVQLAASLAGNAVAEGASLDLARLELVRPRNIWRFPACDHAYAVTVEAPTGEALARLRTLLATMGAGAAWTLHDLQLQPGQPARLHATLRASQALTQDQPGVRLRSLEAEQRLLFPVNDALAGLQQLAGALQPRWGDALHRPLHAESLPDGLCLHAVIPVHGGDDDPADLPDRAGALTATWSVEPLTRRTPLPERRLALADGEGGGPVAAGADAATALWRLPALHDDDLGGVQRALAAAVAS